MLTNFMIRTLKLEIAPRKLITVNFKGMEFAFKTLSKKEYDEILFISSGDEYEAQTLCCEFTYLYPKDYNFRGGAAGLVPSIANIITTESLVSDVEGIKGALETERQRINTLEKQCYIAIISAMPHVTKEMFDNMCWQEIVETVAVAEQVLTVRHSSMLAAVSGESFDFALRFLEGNSEPGKVISEDEKKRRIKAQGDELIERGIDPAIYYGMADVKRVDVITPKVLTGGRYWSNQGVVDIVREELTRK